MKTNHTYNEWIFICLPIHCLTHLHTSTRSHTHTHIQIRKFILSTIITHNRAIHIKRPTAANNNKNNNYSQKKKHNKRNRIEYRMKERKKYKEHTHRTKQNWTEQNRTKPNRAEMKELWRPKQRRNTRGGFIILSHWLIFVCVIYVFCPWMCVCVCVSVFATSLSFSLSLFFSLRSLS